MVIETDREKEVLLMLNRFKRACKPTTFLLVIGFSISLTAVLVGISAMNSLLPELTAVEMDLPILQTMQNTGFMLAASIYLFSILNSFVVTNYWMITKRRNFAIRKAFGWTNKQLVDLICKEMSVILLVSLCISSAILLIIAHMDNNMLSVRLTPAFILETGALMLFTLLFSMIVPIRRVFKIEPAEVI